MSPGSISLKEAYYTGKTPAYSSAILRFFINPASNWTVSIFNKHRAQTSGAQMAGA